MVISADVKRAIEQVRTDLEAKVIALEKRCKAAEDEIVSIKEENAVLKEVSNKTKEELTKLHDDFKEYKEKTVSDVESIKEANKTQIEELKANCENELETLKEDKAEFEETYAKKLKAANTEIDSLKDSKSFLSADVEKIQQLKTNIETNQFKMNELQNRANHAEDHSRRENLLFFGIEESSEFESSQECERKIKVVLADLHKVGDNTIRFDRVHRLGRKKVNEQTGQVITRPIIAKFSDYKDKEITIERIREFGKAQRENPSSKQKVFKISEDYCKATQSIRKDLLNRLKEGKQRNTNIKGGFLRYKTLTVIFDVEGTNVYKSYSLNEIKTKYSTTWFKTPTLRDYS